MVVTRVAETYCWRIIICNWTYLHKCAFFVLYPNFAFISCAMTVNGALVSEKNVSFRRFVIKSWNYYIICEKIIKVWRVWAIKKVVLLSTRYNALLSPPPPCCQQLSFKILAWWLHLLSGRNIRYFHFYETHIAPSSKFIPLPQFAYSSQFKDAQQLYLWCWTKMPSCLLVVLPNRKIKLGSYIWWESVLIMYGLYIFGNVDG